jgi:methylthioribose-1-phosphate isomerase
MSERPAQPPDPGRRRFFRQFAGEVATSMGSVLGAAQVLQQQSADAARELLSGDPPAGAADATADAPGTATRGGPLPEADASTAGFRAPLRWDGDVCWVVDQRRLPDRLADLEVRGAADAVSAINDGAITGGAVQAQLAAVTLALVAGRAASSRAFARRATIRGAANALRQSRPGSTAVGLAVDRVLALVEALGQDRTGEEVADALRAEAEAIIAEASADHGAVVGNALPILPATGDEPLRVLLTGSSGAMAGGQFGTALSALITAHHAGVVVEALVAEGRPGLEGARIATWELSQADVPHALTTDAAAPGCIARGEVDAVLVTAERICANGDVVGIGGTYPLALAAHAAGVPFLVLAATTAVDPGTPGGADAPREEGRPGPVLVVAGTRIAPEGTTIDNPRLDVTPAAVVTAIVTEEGVARAPFDDVLATHRAAADRRRAVSSAGFAALLAQPSAVVS